MTPGGLLLLCGLVCLIAWPFVAHSSNNKLNPETGKFDEKTGTWKGLLIVALAFGVILLLFAIGR